MYIYVLRPYILKKPKGLVQIYGTYPPGFYPESVAFINEKNALHRLVQTSL